MKISKCVFRHFQADKFHMRHSQDVWTEIRDACHYPLPVGVLPARKAYMDSQKDWARKGILNCYVR